MACDDYHQKGRVVAFTAKLNIDDSYPKNKGALKFANVLVNEGCGYCHDSGIFTCPADGFYYFSVHVSVSGFAECAIAKNGVKVALLYHSNLPDMKGHVASVSSVIQLSKGDKVWVDLWGPDRNGIFATTDNDTIFVGYSLKK